MAHILLLAPSGSELGCWSKWPVAGSASSAISISRQVDIAPSRSYFSLRSSSPGKRQE